MAQDSSLSAFWDTRYQQNVTPWESTQLPPDFSAQVAQLLPTVNKVLVPGCGAAYEIDFLRGQGLDVSAIDFSAEAVQRARAHLGQYGHLVQQADFFSPELAGSWDWVYERAFLCALPPARWPAYAEKMASLIRPGGYLAGYFFLRPALKGPPFGCALEQLENLLGQGFALVRQQALQGSLAVFAPDEYFLVWQRNTEFDNRHLI